MVSNCNAVALDFKTPDLRSLLTRPQARARAIAQLAQVVKANGLAGVLVDFEFADNFPHLHEMSMAFTRELEAVLHPLGKTVAYAIPASIEDRDLPEIAGTVDQVFAMLFDEHYSGGDPGPV